MHEWIRTWSYSDQSPVTVSLIFLLFCLINLIPSIVAFIRKHQSKWVIFVLNILLGWTVVGWIITLVWAFSYAGESHRTES
jgi:hypothetical protein